MAITGRMDAGQLGVTLIVQDVAAAADFYSDVLGAQEITRSFSPNPIDPPSKSALAVELRRGGARLIVGRENPRWKEAPRPNWLRSPISAGAPSVGLTIHVGDVDDVFARAVAAGASPAVKDGGPQDTYWGDRVAEFYDPFGHFWRIQTHLEDVAEEDFADRFEALCAAHRAAQGSPAG